MNDNSDKHLNDYPNIKLFTLNDSFYCYDVFSNRIFLITSKHFVELKKLQKLGISVYEKESKNLKESKDIVEMVRHGFFNPTKVTEINNTEAAYLNYVAERSVSEITLQITKQCNLLCRYCSFAIENNGLRNHSNEKMPWEIAKKAVDFLRNHSLDCESVTLSFYGGEPLIAFSLIKKVVEYAESVFSIKEINYVMTTNGIFLNKEIADFLSKYKFRLSISCDGPKNIQNFHRRTKENGGETFDSVLNNIMFLKNNYAVYFNECVTFISVIFDDENPSEVLSFFESIGVQSEKVKITYADLSGVDFKVNAVYSDTGFQLPQKLENKSKIEKEEFDKYAKILSSRCRIPSNWHHNGPCIPGFQRLFVSTQGNFYICEKIAENSNNIIGNIYEGINCSKAEKYMQIGKITENECANCWAMRFCNICALYCVDINGLFSKDVKSSACTKTRNKVLNFLKQAISSNNT